MVRLFPVLFLMLLLSAGPGSFAQTDTEFWFVAPEISKNGGQNFDLPIYLRISTYDQAADVTVSEPANPAFAPIIVNIPANGFSTIDLSAFLDVVENKPANAVGNYGLHIIATSPVSIYYEVASTYCSCNPELFTLKGRNALGTNFMIPTQNHFNNAANYNPVPYNAFDIVATENNTEVIITPSKSIVGHGAGIPFPVYLNRGQTWSALATSQAAAGHLWGSTVTANHAIAITMTDDLLHGITGCADLIGDQVVPVDITGTEYVVVRGNLTNNGNRAFIMATQNNTDIFIDGNPAPVATLATGALYNHNILDASSFISATYPVYVFQTSGFGCELGGALIPSVNCNGSTKVSFTRTTAQQLGVVIATLSTNTGSFLLNGDPTLITPANFTPVPGTSGNWQAANMTFSTSQVPVGSVVAITNTNGSFHLGLMIGDVGGGCSYGYFSDFAGLNLGSDITFCDGESATIHAGTGWDTYAWSNGSTTEFITIGTPGNYSVTVTNPLCSLSDDVVVNVNPANPVSLAISATATSICAGTSVSFTAIPVNPGTSPVYEWTVNNLVVGTDAPDFTYTPLDGDIVACTLTSNVECDQNNPALSNTIQISASAPSAVSVSVTASTGIACAGSQVTYTAVPVNGGSLPAYQWTVNGASAGTNSAQFIYAPLTGDVVACELTSNQACIMTNTATGQAPVVTLIPVSPVSVSISESVNNICPGISVDFIASPVNPGPAPGYQWMVNGTIAGTNAPDYTYVPQNGDIITCELTSNLTCTSGNPASSAPLIMNVIANVPVSVNVTTPTTTVCAETIVTFTAAPQNVGTNPEYLWSVNGTVQGNNSPQFNHVPANGEAISCQLTSDLQCTTGNPAQSNSVVMTVNALPIVSFTTCFDAVTLVSAQPYRLKGGHPPLGTYSGEGITASPVFSPQLAGTGLKTISYTYTDVNFCSASATQTIQVIAAGNFTCGQSFTDVRDGQVYPTVQQGSRCWMQRNLNYGSPVSGSTHQGDNCLPEKYCYQDNPQHCLVNGGLYQWDELLTYQDAPGLQGLCPPGWHIPTQSDWQELFAQNLGQALAGKQLQENQTADFKALAGGLEYANQQWSFDGFATMFWSSTSLGADRVHAHGLNEINYSVSDYLSARSNALSVRCVYD